jgi:Ca-activated chloride channel family protein
VRPGEQLIYRVATGWGQRARARATLESDTQAAAELSIPGITVEPTMIAPNLNSLGRTGPNGGNFWDGSRPVTLSGEGVEVRALNVDSTDSNIESTAAAGDQYVVLSMGGTLGDDGANFAAPVTLTVAVEGEERGEPDYVGEVAGPASATSKDSTKKAKTEKSSASTDDGGAVPWTPIALGVLVVALVGGAFALGRRRPRTGA